MKLQPSAEPVSAGRHASSSRGSNAREGARPSEPLLSVMRDASIDGHSSALDALGAEVATRLGAREAGMDELGAWARFVVGSAAHRMRWVPGGTFVMGSPEGEPGRKDNELQHEVTVDGLWVMESAVTQRLWQQVKGQNPSTRQECGADGPVESVSWFDAIDFANALSKREGLQPAYRINRDLVRWDRSATGYRLLTEAEWEFAARGGEDFVYAGGDDVAEVGWVRENAGRMTHPACAKKRNGYGLFDMSGNVWEWVYDWYGPYRARAEDNPSGPSKGAFRIYRGGCFCLPQQLARVAYRSKNSPVFRAPSLGLRLSRLPP